MEEVIVVTKHIALVEYLRECGIVSGEVRVIEHASPEDVKGKHVVGVLPMWLAALAAKVTEVPLAVTKEERGKELPIERLREIAQPPRTYVVREVETPKGINVLAAEVAATLVPKWQKPPEWWREATFASAPPIGWRQVFETGRPGPRIAGVAILHQDGSIELKASNLAIGRWKTSYLANFVSNKYHTGTKTDSIAAAMEIFRKVDGGAAPFERAVIDQLKNRPIE